MRIIGYGICGKGESKRYLKETLENFKRLCNETIILLNGDCPDERSLIEAYGFNTVQDDREWGKNQHHIKEDFLKNHVAKLNPDATVCLDMDEVLETDRQTIEDYLNKGDAWYVYIANLWNDGYRSDWSFWNVRFWKWDWKEKLGEGFFKFENRPLHCGLAPKWCYHLNLNAGIMLKHYGLMKKEDRMKKVARYEKYDPNQVYRAKEYYEALKQDFSEPFNQEEIQDKLDNHIESIKQPLNKELIMKSKKKVLLVMREADGFVFPVYEEVIHNQLKQKYMGKGFKLISEASKSDDPAPLVEKSEPVEENKTTFVYVANHGQRDVDDTEGHIKRALEEEGYNVICVDQENLPEELPKGDYLLFHKWIPTKEFDGKKVCWYFDKVNFLDREPFMDEVVKMADYVFVTDGTWADSVKKDNVHILRQGVGYNCKGGEKKAGYPEIAFTGALYQSRQDWADRMYEKYGDKFKVYNDKHNDDLNDLCVSAKIMVCPIFPFTNNWWSNRVYNTIGRGGFLIHPRLPGLEKELEDKKHIVYYDDEEDMYRKIGYYLKNPKLREAIQIQGRDYVRENFTYKGQTQKLCSVLSTKKN